jgi:transposase
VDWQDCAVDWQRKTPESLGTCDSQCKECSGSLDELEERLQEVEGQLAEIAKASVVCQRLQTIPGVGLLVATAFAGAVGDISTFHSARRFSSWLGLTPREYSSGNIRCLGSISKRDDGYLRMLLVHGASCAVFRRNGSPCRAATGCVDGVGAARPRQMWSQQSGRGGRKYWPVFCGPPDGTSGTSSFDRREL